ncbi:MAG: ATP-grasp domain-containing protein [Ramlibacter sp.]|nr:ATP-grasp domain-containing protein [Ramlibacter sp.]
MRRLLVANRGEIARRVIRTAHALGMQTVAVYSDVDAGALHVREASAARALGGNASADTYLRIDKLIAAAREAGADAVHPGYGFLSENAVFAQAVIDAGLVWVGPPPRAIRSLGSKSSARQLAQARGVPCLPGYQGEDQSDGRFAAQARHIGFPLMVKASAGGGGRGMRLVTEAGQLQAALQSARSEAQAAFGCGELLLERALLQARHVEVQVFADAHGRCIHLGERDCSVQRRHQKIIEETPSPAVDPALRERMGCCAVELAQAAGYVGAGTVEFLVEDGQFYLMEMNTRLQVEHPVTEAVTGLDLVEWQLRVAQGEPLPLAQDQVRFDGHAIEARLCAEDEHFTPYAGTVRQFLPPLPAEGGRGSLRFDHALFEGLAVPPFYDSMLGKLIVHAPTRAQAIDQLAAALDRTRLLGLPTNRRLLAACLRHPVFRAGEALISFLDRTAGELRALLEDEERKDFLPLAMAALYGAGGRAPDLACAFARSLRLKHRGRVWPLQVRQQPGGALAVEQDGQTQMVLSADAACVRLDDGAWHVQSGALDLIVEDASFEPAGGAGGASAANELRAPFNGKVIAVKARSGAMVARGETLLVIESMKLEHALAASRDGVVKAVHVQAGQQACTSQVLVTFEAAPAANGSTARSRS